MVSTMKEQHFFSPFPSALLTLAILLLSGNLASAQDANAVTPSGSLSDGQILQVMRVLNEAGIERAGIAQEGASNLEIKNIAQLIITDHTNSNRLIEDIEKSGIELEESPLSDELLLKGEQIKANLIGASYEQFDCTYLQGQFDQSELALDTISNVLMPIAIDSQVQEILTSSTLKLQHHLDTTQETLAAAQCG